MEVKDVLSLIGFEGKEGEDISLDMVRDFHNSHFLSTNEVANRKDLIEPIVSKAIGERLGSIQTKLISSAKDLGLDFSHADFKDKKVEDVLPVVFGNISEKLKSTSKSDSKLQDENDRIKKEYSTLQDSIKTFEQQISDLNTNHKQEKTNWIKSHAEGEAWKKLPFSPQAKDLEKIGFETTIKSKYDTFVDDDGNIYPVYKAGEKKGSRVQNPDKLSDHLGWEDLLRREAKQLGLLAEKHEGKPTIVNARTNNNQQNQTNPNQQLGVRALHPRFANTAS